MCKNRFPEQLNYNWIRPIYWIFDQFGRWNWIFFKCTTKNHPVGCRSLNWILLMFYFSVHDFWYYSSSNMKCLHPSRVFFGNCNVKNLWHETAPIQPSHSCHVLPLAHCNELHDFQMGIMWFMVLQINKCYCLWIRTWGRVSCWGRARSPSRRCCCRTCRRTGRSEPPVIHSSWRLQGCQIATKFSH